MFEKSKIIAQLTNFETAAGIDEACCKAIAQIASVSGLMDKTVRFVKDDGEPALGGAYLVMCLCELASETNPPVVIVDALEELLAHAIQAIEVHRTKSPVLSSILFNAALEIQLKLLSTSLESEGQASDETDAEAEQATSAGNFPLAGNMPDVTRRQPSRAFRAGKYLILFLKDVPPIAEQLGPNPMKLRFIYVLAVIDSESKRPVYFVTLESSVMAADLLCTIDGGGTHSTLGAVPSLREERAFIERALGLVRRQLAVDHIQELKR